MAIALERASVEGRRAAPADLAIQEGVAQRHDAVHDPHVRTVAVRPQPGADPLGDVAAKSIQLLVGAQLDPQLDVVPLVLGDDAS